MPRIPSARASLTHTPCPIAEPLSPSRPLREQLHLLPEFIPAPFQSPTHEDIGILDRLFVRNSVAVPRMRHQLTRRKMLLQEFSCVSNRNHRLWSRISVPSLPGRIHSADCLWQSVPFTVQIQGAHLPIVPRQDS